MKWWDRFTARVQYAWDRAVPRMYRETRCRFVGCRPKFATRGRCIYCYRFVPAKRT